MPTLPSYLGHVVSDYRQDLVANKQARTSDGTAERAVTAQKLADEARPDKCLTVDTDTVYDTGGPIRAFRRNKVTPHTSQNIKRSRGGAIDGRTTRHASYAVSQRKRKRNGQRFGGKMLIGPARQKVVTGLDKVDHLQTLTMAGFELTRLRALAKFRVQRAL